MSVYESLDFQPVVLSDLFKLHRGKQPPSGRDDSGKTPYIGAASRGNSQVGWTGEEPLFPGHWLAIVNTGAGGVGYCTYQPVPFYPSNNVTALEPLYREASPEALIVLAATIRHQAFGFFGYGNIANNKRLSVLRIMVPVLTAADGTITPDWDGMKALGQELQAPAVERAGHAFVASPDDDDALPDLDFQPMFITDAFDSLRTTQAWYNKQDLAQESLQNFAFVSRTEMNNGIDGFCGQQQKKPEAENAITIALDTQVVKYQPVKFYTSQNIQVIRDDHLNEFNAIVICTLIKQQMVKFSWGGNGATLGRLTKTRIMIPVLTAADGTVTPNWEGMTQLGRALRVRAERKARNALGAYY
ncbi:restriction endonuclease subunit S [Corynebacterium tuberculostearicum]|uniref:restriction endonuclease subunit S n=1 Tax=Corynebacterium tuberculostearicum TaxID=38304 RepID=UPI002934605D|nr:restriction endonuclease subunit S [Corynebacterium tuberculostearicum]MDV2428189.1 restriction endonuclease subunit S [Corynebacterium tuberculostearicum]